MSNTFNPLKALNVVMSDKKLTATEKSILACMITFTNGSEPRIKASQDAIATKVGVSRKTVNRFVSSPAADRYFTKDSSRRWLILSWLPTDLLGHEVTLDESLKGHEVTLEDDPEIEEQKPETDLLGQQVTLEPSLKGQQVTLEHCLEPSLYWDIETIYWDTEGVYWDTGLHLSTNITTNITTNKEDIKLGTIIITKKNTTNTKRIAPEARGTGGPPPSNSSLSLEPSFTHILPLSRNAAHAASGRNLPQRLMDVGVLEKDIPWFELRLKEEIAQDAFFNFDWEPERTDLRYRAWLAFSTTQELIEPGNQKALSASTIN